MRGVHKCHTTDLLGATTVDAYFAPTARHSVRSPLGYVAARWMSMRATSWEVPDGFGERIKPLLPARLSRYSCSQVGQRSNTPNDSTPRRATPQGARPRSRSSSTARCAIGTTLGARRRTRCAPCSSGVLAVKRAPYREALVGESLEIARRSLVSMTRPENHLCRPTVRESRFSLDPGAREVVPRLQHT